MSSFCYNRDSAPILAAADEWKRRCLLSDGSVFGNDELWKSSLLDELDKHFVQNLDAGEGNFEEKLVVQLRPASAAAKKLAAEMMWVMLLCPSSMKTTSKLAAIREIWEWSGDQLPINAQPLSDPVLVGVGSAGMGYNMYRWRELVFFINLMRTFKARTAEQRRECLASNGAFAELIDSIPEADSRQLRHMLMFLLFPDSSERIFGGKDRKAIVRAFSGKSRAEVEHLAAAEVDAELLRIRREREKQLGTDKFDFYLPDVIGEWRPAAVVDEEPAVDKGSSGSTGSKNLGEPEPPYEAPRQYGIKDALEDLFVDEAELRRWLRLLGAKRNVIIQGPPGVGKSFVARRLAYALMKAADLERVGMVQFHQSYSYEDFVQGYRPSKNGFERRNGVFYEFCDLARSKHPEPCVFIVDEINRGNLSKVFGELMLLIEADKRGAAWAVPLTYSTELAETFYVPDNVYIIGLMNTADRSLAMVDYALRRRFAFIDLLPAFDSPAFREHLRDHGAESVLENRIVSDLSDLNREIASDSNLGKGFCIGHSYFCNVASTEQVGQEWYRHIVESEIAPLLREYWFDDEESIVKWQRRLMA